MVTPITSKLSFKNVSPSTCNIDPNLVVFATLNELFKIEAPPTLNVLLNVVASDTSKVFSIRAVPEILTSFSKMACSKTCNVCSRYVEPEINTLLPKVATWLTLNCLFIRTCSDSPVSLSIGISKALNNWGGLKSELVNFPKKTPFPTERSFSKVTLFFTVKELSITVAPVTLKLLERVPVPLTYNSSSIVTSTYWRVCLVTSFKNVVPKTSKLPLNKVAPETCRDILLSGVSDVPCNCPSPINVCPFIFVSPPTLNLFAILALSETNKSLPNIIEPPTLTWLAKWTSPPTLKIPLVTLFPVAKISSYLIEPFTLKFPPILVSPATVKSAWLRFSGAPIATFFECSFWKLWTLSLLIIYIYIE